MTTEYHIQKRGLAVWQYVTWYETYEEAKANFDKLKAGQGWSYRLVELKVVDEAKLEGEREDVEPDHSPEPVIKNSGWGATPTPGDWGKPTTIHDIKPEGQSHGLAGSVWMVHFGLKKKTRVPMSEMNALLEQGYVKGSPRTVL